MNTPNPLMPQGSLPKLQSKAKSTVRILLLIAAVHAVFFTGVLLSQGCGPKTDIAKSPKATNNEANALAPIDTNYYSSFREVPAVTTNVPAAVDLGVQQTNLPLVSTPLSPPPPVREAPAEAKEYTIVRGDTLGGIALAQRVKLGLIVKANPDLDPAKLRLGQKIVIPAAPSAPAPSIGSLEPGTGESGAGTTHVVKAGENLIKIAKQHKTTPKAIKAANNMKTDQLLVGKKLKIPAPSPSAASSKTSKATPPLPHSIANPDRAMPLRASSTTTNIR